MVYVGMIFQLDSSTGSGLMMFSDGDKRSFSASDWVDEQNAPAVGQKVSYEIIENSAQIRVAGADAVITSVPPEIQQSTQGESSEKGQGFNSLEEYIESYTSLGFRLVKDNQEGLSRILAFRKMEMGDPVEVIITQRGLEISVKKTVNGKVVED